MNLYPVVLVIAFMPAVMAFDARITPIEAWRQDRYSVNVESPGANYLTGEEMQVAAICRDLFIEVYSEELALEYLFAVDILSGRSARLIRSAEHARRHTLVEIMGPDAPPLTIVCSNFGGGGYRLFQYNSDNELIPVEPQ